MNKQEIIDRLLKDGFITEDEKIILLKETIGIRPYLPPFTPDTPQWIETPSLKDLEWEPPTF